MAIKSYATIDQAYSEVIYAVGLALTQWQNIELKLYQLFVYLCGDSDRRAISVIFHEMPLEVRLRALVELIRLRDESQLKPWDSVLKVVHKQRRMRDRLAHWAVVGAPNEDGSYVAFLSPPTTDDRSRVVIENAQNALGAQELIAKSREFQLAAGAVDRFMKSFPEIA